MELQAAHANLQALSDLEYTDKAKVAKLSSKLMTPKCSTSKYFNVFNLLSKHVQSPRSS